MSETVADEFPKACGSGASNMRCYVAEIRVHEESEPFVMGNFLITHKWKEIPTAACAIGVPASPWAPRHFSYFTKAGAEAIRWWCLANIENGHFSYRGCETRIVEILVEETHKTTRTEALSLITHGKEARQESKP